MKFILVIVIMLISLGGLMAQMQDKLKPACAWTSFMGCTQSCTDYLGCNYSADWLYGVTGYAWLLNIFPGVCPSGPTAFDNTFLIDNAGALGLKFESLNFSKRDPDFAQKQKDAFLATRKALERGLPTFGWELGIPEYYLIAGTDSTGYLFFDMDGSVQHCAWDKLGTSDIGMVEIHSLDWPEKDIPPVDQVRAALSFLQKYQSHPEEFALEGYTQGPGGYDVWIEALQKGEGDLLGIPYNARVWFEARSHAAGFLREAKTRLGDRFDYNSLDRAIESYSLVARSLEGVCAIYPFPSQKEDMSAENAAKAIEFLSTARQAELAGIKSLLEFANQL